MKKYLMMGVAVAALASCTNHDFDFYDEEAVLEFNKNQIVEKYNQAFIANIGQPAVNQGWGFGTATRGLTRAVFSDTWSGDHTDATYKFNFFNGATFADDWQSKLDFSLPTDYVTVDQNTQIKSGSVYYVPETFNGTISFDNFSGDLYVAGNVTGFNGNSGNLNLYILEKGTWSKGFSTGDIYIYNNGNLVLGGYDLQNSNVKAIYNGGYFSLGTKDSGLNTSNSVQLYSTGVVELTGTGTMDYKFPSDIHGKMKVNGNIKIQNGTAKYICGIEATGKVENVDGPLITSNLIANELSFDGNPLYLTEGGYINVATLFNMPNSNCHVYAVEGSNALIETQDFHFENKGDLVHSFSQNIYFQVSGYIELSGCYINNDGNYHKYTMSTDLEKLLANTADELDKVAGRLNAGDATGSPACGQPWTVGTPTTTPEPEEPTDPDPEDDGLTFLCRIFAEDLSASTGSDFDFNDVVFDVYNNAKTGEAKVKILAAGGTLPLTVAGKEVHEEFAKLNPGANITTSTMINTADYGSVEAKVCPEFSLSGIYDLSNAKDIEIAVEKEIGEIAKDWFVLTAETGKPAAKFAVTEPIDWCNEREEITGRYPGFEGWVTGSNANSRWWE